MAYKKQGTPEEGEIVLCTVKKILRNSVFVELEEYNSVEGILHTYEVAAGRIRTLFDYVREGKQIICKVLRINHEHNSVDLSLRRVSDVQRKKKTEAIKKEIKAEKVLEVIAKELKIKPEEAYKDVGLKLVEEYGSINSGFEEVVKEGEEVLTNAGIEKKIAATITTFIKQRIKPPEVIITRILSLKNKQPDGIERIKESIKKIEEFAKKEKKELEITYVGSPKYKLLLKAEDYKTAEGIMKEIEELIKDDAKKKGGEAEMEKGK